MTYQFKESDKVEVINLGQYSNCKGQVTQVDSSGNLIRIKLDTPFETGWKTKIVNMTFSFDQASEFLKLIEDNSWRRGLYLL